ncbi:MAG: hypothetical protein FJ304_14810 [Planctomycetes bacterium]|nr:hypothetical protein [Planctomycetota bacterium]
MSATVEESADALAYTFRPLTRVARPTVPFSFALVLVFLPLLVLMSAVVALNRAANRPDWELALSVVLVLQLLLWLVAGAVQLALLLRMWFRSNVTTLRFTRTHLWHGPMCVCPLERLRGVRLFVYPSGDAREAHMSFVIGDDEQTHGVFGAFPGPALRAFAQDLSHRVAAFCANQGLMATLAPLSEVEATEADANERMHTLPAPPGLRAASLSVVGLVVRNRVIGSVWCVVLIAGLAASARMAVGVGLKPQYLVGHAIMGAFHVMLLLAHLRGQRPGS